MGEETVAHHRSVRYYVWQNGQSVPTLVYCLCGYQWIDEIGCTNDRTTGQAVTSDE